MRTVSRRTGFWIVAYVFAATMVGNTLPTPLYVIYQAQWHFASGMITLIFASYAAGVLAALLLAGRSSDQVGRRAVLAAAVVFSALSTVAFIVASNVGWLFAGRILSGLSAGLVTGTGTAMLTELSTAPTPRRASMVATAATTGGLGLGPLIAGLFAQFGPNPTVLVFQAYLVLLVLAAIGLAVVPETVPTRTRLRLRFVGFGIPSDAKTAFLAASVAGFAALALLGLFTALAPSFLGGVLHQRNHAISGLVVFLIFAASTLTQLTMSRLPSQVSTRFGLSLFVVALGFIVVALQQASLPLFLLGTVISGVAVGGAFIGSLSTANRVAPPATRGQVVSTYFTFAYIGLTLPVIGVGFAAQQVGDFAAVLGCAVALTCLCLAALLTGSRSRAA